MRASRLGLCFAMTSVLWSCAPQVVANSPARTSADSEQEVLGLSRQKWLWTAERDVDALSPLLHDQSVFVHMGGTWGKEQEVEIIRSGAIH